MAGKIGVVIHLDGEQKFVQSMKSAQTSAKNCKDELKRMSTEMSGSANTVQSLTKKQEALKKAQESYQKVLTAAKTGQSNAQKAFEEQRKAVEQLQKQYDAAKKALDELEREGQQGTKAYEKQKAEVDRLSASLDKQTGYYYKAEQRVHSWEGKVSQAESDLRQVDTELQKNSRYLEEASSSADSCARSIDEYGDEVSQTAEQIEDASESQSKFMETFAAVGLADLAVSGLKKVGQAAVDAAKYTVEVGSTFEASMSKVAALSGASSQELSSMEEMAKQLGNTTRFSAAEVADGFSYMALAGWSAQQSLDAMPGILDLAAASQMDLAQASDMVTDYLSAFGMEAADATKMADMMAYAQANSNTSAQQLGEAYGNCAANLHAAGQDIETTTSFLEAFANQGVKGSEAGTKLSAIMRDMTSKMKDGKIMIGDTAVEVMDASGNFRDLTDIMIDVEAATDGMGTAQRTAALSTTFTAKSIGGMNMILTEGMTKISGYETDLRSCDGAASAMAKTMQDNLQGKIVEFNSATSGLGIKLYEYFSGPLSGAVGLATKLINGITEALTPQRTELEQFIKGIDESNKAVQQSLEHAQKTMEEGQQKAAEISAAGEQISEVMKSCEQFNQITLEDGTTQIVDASGKVVLGFQEIDGQIHVTQGELSGFDTTGLSVSQIVQKALEAQQGIGFIKTEAENAEQKLEHFADRGIKTDGVSKGKAAIIELFNDAGEKVDEFSADVSEAGNVQLKTDKLDQSVSLMVTCFDPVTQKVTTFQGDLDSLNGTQLNLSGVRDSFDEVGSSVRTTYQITDEFTRMKIDSFVNTFGGSVEGLAQAWDSNTGSLTASREELEKWFSVAQQVAMYDAYKDAADELYKAYADAWVNITKSQSAENELLRQFNELAGTNYKTFQEYAEGTASSEKALSYAAREVGGALLDQHAKTEEYVGVMQEAQDEISTTGEALESAANGLSDLGVEVDETTGEVKAAGDAAETAGDQIQGMGEDAEDAEEAVKEFGISAAEQAKNLKTAYKDASKAIKDAVEDAKASAKSAFSINPFESWKINDEHGMDTFAKAMEEQIASMQSYASNLQTVSEHVGKEITPEFLEYLEGLGEDGAKLLSDIAKEFDENGDPKKVQEIVDQYMEALNAQEEIARVTAANALAMKLGMKEFGSTEEEWADVTQSLHEGIDSWGTELDQGLKDGLETAIETAQALGVKIPDGMMEAIEQGSTDPEQAITYMTQLIEQAISGHQQGLIEAAAQCGITIPEELSTAIAQGGPAAEEAWKQVVELISGAEVDTSVAKQTGAELIGEATEGMSEGEGEASAAAQTVAEAAGEALSAANEKFRSAGSIAMVAFSTAITNYRSKSDSAASAAAQTAAQAAQGQSGLFETAGSTDASSFVSGMGSIDTTGAGNILASAALGGASGYYDSFYSVGSNLGSGLYSGLSSWAGTIAQKASAMVSDAVAAAKAAGHIQSPSKVFRDQVGKMIGAGLALGIEQSTDLVTDAATEQMNKTLHAMRNWLLKNIGEIRKDGTSYAEAASYSWQQLASQQLDAGFGISKTKTTGTGENEKTVNKSAEEYASEVYRAAQQYMRNVEILYEVSDAEAESYWKNVRSHLKGGTQAWFDATEQIKRAREAQKEAAAKQRQEEKEAEEKRLAEEEKRRQEELEKLSKHDANLLSSSEKYLEHKKILQDVSVSYEIRYWEKIQARMKQGSDEWYTVTKKLKDLRQSQADDAKAALEAEQERQKQQEEELAKHDSKLLTRAEKYLSQKKILQNVSVSYEIRYWEKIQARMKEGSDEWYTVTQKLKDLRSQQADDAAKAYTKILTDAQDYVNRKKRQNQMSITQEIEYWTRIREQLTKGTKEYRTATEMILSAQSNIGTVGNASSLLDTYQTYYEMSERAQMQYWQEVRKHYKAGTSERVQADKQYLSARKKYYDDLKKMDTEYQTSRSELIQSRDEQIEKLRQNLADQRAQIEQSRDEKIADAHEKLTEKLKSINNDLAKNIASVKEKLASDVEALRQTYRDAVESRKQELMSAFDLFSAFESQSATGEELLFNLQSQAAGYKDWMRAVTKLQKRGILSDELMEEIRGKGPQDSAAVHALLSLSNEQLRQYNEAYQTKSELSQAQAEKENQDLLRQTHTTILQLKADAKEEIRQLREQAKADRQAARTETKAEIKGLREAARSQIKDLKSETRSQIKDLRSETSKKLTELKTTYTSERRSLRTAINSDILTLAKNIKSIASDQVSALSAAFTSSVSKLAGAGSSTGSAVSKKTVNAAGAADLVKKAKKNAGGNKSVQDYFAWMDEMGIGSEMIIRQDGARLNTHIQPGDAIVPAVNTENLWEWSKLDPAQLIRDLRARQATMNAKALTFGVRSTAGGNDMVSQMLSGMYSLLQQYMPYMAEQKTINVDGRELASVTSPYMSEELAMRSRRRRGTS